jgi:hypothetical protein
LNPYSSISFFRCSSALFRAFLFFQKNNNPTTNKAMATIGTTTATAIFPPCDSPPVFAALTALLVAIGAAREEEDWVEDEDSVRDEMGWGVGDAVDVMTTTEGVPVPPVEAGLCVMIEVNRTTELVAGNAADVCETKELVGALNEEVWTKEEVGGCTKEELVWLCEVAGPDEVAISKRLFSITDDHCDGSTHPWRYLRPFLLCINPKGGLKINSTLDASQKLTSTRTQRLARKMIFILRTQQQQ